MKKTDRTAERRSPEKAGLSQADMSFSRSALGQRLMELHGAGSPSNRAIADTLLRNPLHASAWGIEEFAAASGVSPATLSRFARALGFGGYAELRSAVAATMQSIVNPVEKLRGRFAPAPPDAPTPLIEGLETLLSNVRATAEGLTPALVDEVVKRLTAAKTVYIMGFGLSAHVAALLALGLQPFCRQLQNVVEFGGTEVAAGRLMNVGAGDVLVVLSIPRYATDAVHLTAYARDRKASVIAITDSPASPLVPLADCILLARSNHPVLSSSTAALMIVVEAIVAAMMLSNRDNVNQAEKLTDAISTYLYRADQSFRPVPGPAARTSAD